MSPGRSSGSPRKISSGAVVGRRCAQFVGRGLGPDRHDRVLLPRHEVTDLDEAARVSVEANVGVGCHLVGVRSGRHHRTGQPEDLDLLADRSARRSGFAGVVHAGERTRRQSERVSVELGQRDEAPIGLGVGVDPEQLDARLVRQGRTYRPNRRRRRLFCRRRRELRRSRRETRWPVGPKRRR